MRVEHNFTPAHPLHHSISKKRLGLRAQYHPAAPSWLRKSRASTQTLTHIDTNTYTQTLLHVNYCVYFKIFQTCPTFLFNHTHSPSFPFLYQLLLVLTLFTPAKVAACMRRASCALKLALGAVVLLGPGAAFGTALAVCTLPLTFPFSVALFLVWYRTSATHEWLQIRGSSSSQATTVL